MQKYSINLLFPVWSNFDTNMSASACFVDRKSGKEWKRKAEGDKFFCRGMKGVGGLEEGRQAEEMFNIKVE